MYCVQSLLRSNSSNLKALAGSVTAAVESCQGTRIGSALSIQPSLYSPCTPIISKYWVWWCDGAFALALSNV